jgi:hypothetical protein
VVRKKTFADLSENLRLATIGGESFKKLIVNEMGYEIMSYPIRLKSLEQVSDGRRPIARIRNIPEKLQSQHFMRRIPFAVDGKSTQVTSRKKKASVMAKEGQRRFRSIGASSEKLIGEGGDRLGHFLRIGHETTWKPEQRIKYSESKVTEETQEPETHQAKRWLSWDTPDSTMVHSDAPMSGHVK